MTDASSSSRTQTWIGAVGARTAAGENAPSTAAAVRSGISCFAEDSSLVDTEGQPVRTVRIPYVSEAVSGTERLVELARAAALEALQPILSKPGARKSEIPLILGLPPKRPGLSDTLDRDIADQLKVGTPETAPWAAVQVLQGGHAAGLQAIAEGWKQVASGKIEMCLAGGVDSYLDAETIEWLEAQEQLHKEAFPWGIVPGEAAGFCLLISDRAARSYSLQPKLSIRGAGTAKEPCLIKTETVCVGKGLTEAVQGALGASFPGRGEKIQQTFCDLNGEPYRAEEFGFMLSRTSERFVNPADFVAPADCWGDVGAASGPLFVVLADAAARKGYAKGQHSLLWASSEGGDRCALVLSAEGKGD